jgi:hypothetical protein
MYPKLKLKRNAERRLASGHLWVFSNELEEIPKLEAGSLVEVVGSDSRSFGLGFYNPASLISANLTILFSLATGLAKQLNFGILYSREKIFTGLYLVSLIFCPD